MEDVFNPKPAIKLGIIIWFLGFIYSMIVMILVGVDFSEPNFEFGPSHPKYGLFVLVMTPSFLLISIVLLYRLFVNNETNLQDSWKVGIIISLIQFLLDTIVLVVLFGNGIEYFFAFVTISYLTIPLWSHLTRKFIATN